MSPSRWQSIRGKRQDASLKRYAIGTRGSALARWQANYVATLLHQAWQDLIVEIVVITTGGDRALDVPLPLLGGKGAFTEELETALRTHQLDIAVHSLKDLPIPSPQGLILGAIPLRGSVHDVLISREGFTVETLPSGAVIGTGSPRRAAQLRGMRPDLQIVSIRGNIDTRIAKALEVEGQYDGIVLAEAGLERLGRMNVISQVIPLDTMLPAPGQGALAVQCRDEDAMRHLLAPIQHAETAAAVSAERGFLAGMGSGCSLPVAAYAHITEGRLMLHGRVCSPDGQRRIDLEASTYDIAAAEAIGVALGQQAIAQGGAAMMEQS